MKVVRVLGAPRVNQAGTQIVGRIIYRFRVRIVSSQEQAAVETMQELYSAAVIGARANRSSRSEKAPCKTLGTVSQPARGKELSQRRRGGLPWTG